MKKIINSLMALLIFADTFLAVTTPFDSVKLISSKTNNGALVEFFPPIVISFISPLTPKYFIF